MMSRISLSFREFLFYPNLFSSDDQEIRNLVSFLTAVPVCQSASFDQFLNFVNELLERQVLDARAHEGNLVFDSLPINHTENVPVRVKMSIL